MSFFRKSPVPASLRSSPLAQELPAAELRQLSQLGTVIDVPQGQRVIAESTRGTECFIVLEGEFDVSTASTELHASIQSGEVAGELALLTGQPRSASVVAASDATICALHSREFAALFSQAHRFRTRVLTMAQNRLSPDAFSLQPELARLLEKAAVSQQWSGLLSEMPTWRPVSM